MLTLVEVKTKKGLITPIQATEVNSCLCVDPNIVLKHKHVSTQKDAIATRYPHFSMMSQHEGTVF